MQKCFLESIAAYYVQKYKTDLSSFCFVFPGRRAGLFFLNYLNRQISRPAWAPQILTINELFEQTSSLVTVDNISLLFDLHALYNEILGQETTFDEFISWGEMFLNDFNDIDKHLVNAEQLYSNLSALKELEDDFSYLSTNQLEAIISFWGTFNVKKLSSDQKKFIGLWEKLYTLYKTFEERLMADGKAFPGMHYRIVAENIKNKNFPGFTCSKFVFAGFNALTPAEKTLFDHLKNLGKADFFWDYSGWITQKFNGADHDLQGNNGAGLFITENIKRYPPPSGWSLPVPDESSQPEITLVPVPTSLDQVTEINSFLLESNPDDLNTALVLTDENMLIPALHGIPVETEHINITMGYPMKNTPAYGLTGLLFNLQKQLRKGKDNKTWFYHKQVVPLLQHQYITLLAPEESKKFLKDIISGNRLFIEADEFKDSELFSHIFRKIGYPVSVSAYLKDIFKLIFLKLNENSDKTIEREFIYSVVKTINRLDDILKAKNAVIETSTWFGLLNKLLEFQTVPFEGEPLAGLQVMGILETRALDFENLIILNLNEGTFPRTSAPNTFIPYSLRIGFGLPTIEHQDNIFSYYFFRLLHRVKKVSLVYTTSTQGNKSGEMSRFLYTLKYLYPQRPSVKIYAEEVKLLSVPEIVTKKTKEIQAGLDRFLEGGDKELSASSISKYLECPMKFYYQKIAEIKEPDELTEDIDARIFGNIFHKVAETLYKPYRGKVINGQDIEEMAGSPQKISDLIEVTLKEELSGTDFKRAGFQDLSGKNEMIKEVLFKYILQFLKREKEQSPFTVTGLEEEVKHVMQTNSHAVRLKGYVDRIDFKEGVYRVIDYKTGASQNTFKNVDELFDPEQHSKVKAVFQTILYSYILSEKDKDGKYRPCILNIKDLYKPDFNINVALKAPRQKGQEILIDDVRNEFESNMMSLLDEIFNPDNPFTQTDDIKKCEYCAYKSLCRR